MTERLPQDRQLLPNLEVSLDPETQFILNSKPKDILDRLFPLSDPDRAFLLPDTGFSMEGQLRTWINGYKESLASGEPLTESHRRFVRRTLSDVASFYYEYLSGQDIFPNPLEFRINEEGQKIIFAVDYDTTLDKLSEKLREATGEDEREGAMERGIKRATEMLIHSDPGNIVIINSTKGWSNLTNNGKPIVYPDNQTYAYFVNEEENLESLTLRSDIALTIAEKMSGTFNLNPDLSQKERIKAVVEKPVKFKGRSIEEVVDLIEKYAGKKYHKLRNEVKNRKSLFELNGDAKEIMNNLKLFLENDISPFNLANIRAFVVGVGKSILDLSEKALENKLIKLPKNSRYRISSYRGYSHYNSLLEIVQTLEGCNGGGKQIAEQIQEDAIKSGEMRLLRCTCPFCGKEVLAIISGGTIHCTNCDKSGPYKC